MKDRQRAADCNKRCIVLASSIYPVPYSAGWYRVSSPAFKDIVRGTGSVLADLHAVWVCGCVGSSPCAAACVLIFVMAWGCSPMVERALCLTAKRFMSSEKP